jgi:hypothetical protein
MRTKIQLWHQLPMFLGVGLLAGAGLIVPAAGANATVAASADTNAAATAVHRGTLPPGHPAVSLPDSALLASCGPGDGGVACDQLALAAINQARRALEKLGGMSFSLPAYARLTPVQQLFVVVNLERTERGLAPAVVLSRSLNKVAQAGARAGRDPALTSVPRRLPGGGRTVYASANWAGGWVNPLGADYAWMYDDGPGGNNLDCRTASSPLCWGHRDNILNRFGDHASCPGASALAMGAGHAATARGYRESDTVLLAGGCGPVPTDAVLTWAKAKKLLHIR